MLDPVIERGVVRAVARLIAERPDNNARVVTVAFHHARDALAVGAKPHRIVRKTAHRLHAVGFNVGFIHHVQPVAAAQLIPARLVGVVRTAHGVKVVLLHQQDILHHRRLVHRLAFFRVMLVTVNAADQQRLAVKRQQTVADFHATKADVVRLRDKRHAVGIQQRHHRAVQVRRFGAPQQRVVNVKRERDALRVVATLINRGGAERQRLARHFVFTAPQRESDAEPACGGRHFHVAEQRGVTQRRRKLGMHAHIGQRLFREMQQADRAENPAHAPHILIFQISAVRPAQHQHAQAVAARVQHAGEIELRRQAAVLRIPHPLPVTPEIKRRIHAAEDNARAARLQPRLRHLNIARIAAGRVVVRHKRRIHRDRVAHIGVDRRVVAFHLPV
ncbi:hypothetical protein BN131_3184 [Cronobacter malonaticus 681]|nr:hypothetical protein BN131_3184 [Cronobacter malonaticus 681]